MLGNIINAVSLLGHKAVIKLEYALLAVLIGVVIIVLSVSSVGRNTLRATKPALRSNMRSWLFISPL